MVGLRLFLPETWTNDPERMARAGVPKDRQTALTKPEIAIEEIDRVIASGVRFSGVLADSGYGSSGPFRQALSERGLKWRWVCRAARTSTQPTLPLSSRSQKLETAANTIFPTGLRFPSSQCWPMRNELCRKLGDDGLKRAAYRGGTGIGAVPVKRAKLRDRAEETSGDDRITFTSAILPKWARRTKSLDALLPILYLCGISTGDFQEALAALLGKDAPNLSPSVIGRLKEEWQADYDRWQRHDLSARRYVYIWADGVYLQARMEDDAACMLVVIGATPEGKKELVGFQVGARESTQSWRELLVDLKARGLSIAPEIAVGDGALGFWKAVEEIFPSTRHQRCWQHKLVNILNKIGYSA